MQYYHSARGGKPPAAVVPIRGLIIHENPTCAPTLRKGAHESAPKRQKVALWAPKGGKWTPNGAKKKAKWRQNRLPKRLFTKSAESDSDLLFTIYYQHLPSCKSSLFHPQAHQKCMWDARHHFFVPRAALLAPLWPKNGESGVPWESECAPRPPKCLPKCT